MVKNRTRRKFEQGLLIAAGLWVGILACNPYEKMTETLSDAADKVLPSNNNDADKVGQVIPKLSYTSASKATFAVTVLTQSNNLVKNDTPVTCSFFVKGTTTPSTKFDGLTSSGVVSCSVDNLGSKTEMEFIATSSGVSSSSQFFFLGSSSGS